jgi:hypothetical protein
MYRILQTARLLPSSFVIRLNSTSKIPVRNLLSIEDDDDDDDNLKKIKSPKDHIFADSKSSKFKEKNKRKQKQWIKELEHRHIVPQTPLSPFTKENKPTSEKFNEQKSDNKIIR